MPRGSHFGFTTPPPPMMMGLIAGLVVLVLIIVFVTRKPAPTDDPMTTPEQTKLATILATIAQTLAPTDAPTYAPTAAPTTLAAILTTIAQTLAPTAAPITLPPFGGRYVMVQQDAQDSYFGLTSLEVYSGVGTPNIALNKPVSARSPLNTNVNLQALTDGKNNGTLPNLAINGPGAGGFLKVDLGSNVPIASIIVRNNEVCGDRAVGAILTIINDAGTVVYTSDLFPDKYGKTNFRSCANPNVSYGSYTINPPSTSVVGGN